MPVRLSRTPFWPVSGMTSLGSVRISRPDLGSLRMFLTKYTGPVNGSLRTGVTAVAVPTIDAFGHVGSTFEPSTNSQSPLALSGSKRQRQRQRDLDLLEVGLPGLLGHGAR